MSVRSLVPAQRRRPIIGLTLLSGALMFAVAACGSSAPATTAAPATSASQSGGQNRQAPPGTSGTAAAVSGSSIEVQNPANGQVTVNFNSSTTFTNQATATMADVTAGECVTVTGASGGTGNVTATSVRISQPTGGSCMAGAGRGGGFGGGSAGRGGAGRGGSASARPSGGNRAGSGRATGTVSAVTGSTFTVASTNRSGATNNTVVTVTASTMFTKSVTATSSAVAVGDCVTAIGATDDTGAVTATSITVSKPGPNGCTTGFGRGRNQSGNGNNAGGTSNG